jgi:hypothetical protein
MGPGVFTAKLEKSLNLSVDNNFQKNCLTWFILFYSPD